MKKGWKKTISAVLCAGMVLSMAACGSKNDSTAKEDGGASGDAEYKVLYVSRNQADTFAARLSSELSEMLGEHL